MKFQNFKNYSFFSNFIFKCTCFYQFYISNEWQILLLAMLHSCQMHCVGLRLLKSCLSTFAVFTTVVYSRYGSPADSWSAKAC